MELLRGTDSASGFGSSETAITVGLDRLAHAHQPDRNNRGRYEVRPHRPHRRLRPDHVFHWAT